MENTFLELLAQSISFSGALIVFTCKGGLLRTVGAGLFITPIILNVINA